MLELSWQKMTQDEAVAHVDKRHSEHSKREHAHKGRVRISHGILVMAAANTRTMAELPPRFLPPREAMPTADADEAPRSCSPPTGPSGRYPPILIRPLGVRRRRAPKAFFKNGSALRPLHVVPLVTGRLSTQS